MNIVVMKDGVSIGFVKSISEKKNSFAITQSKDKAKEYKNENIIQRDIDILTRISSEKEFGYIFLYIWY